jgi:hypothetical protein
MNPGRECLVATRAFGGSGAVSPLLAHPEGVACTLEGCVGPGLAARTGGSRPERGGSRPDGPWPSTHKPGDGWP